MKVFIDSSAWIALEIWNDQHHSVAKIYKEKLKSLRAHLLTNSCVLVETYTRLIYDVNLGAAEEFHQRISEGVREGNLSVFEIGEADRGQAWQELKHYSDHKLSFTDATIIVNFKNYRLDEIFTFDKHFKALNLPVSNF